MNSVERYIIEEVKSELLKMKGHANLKKNSRTEENFNCANIKSSDEYFDFVSHQIPISELYQLLDTCSNSEEN